MGEWGLLTIILPFLLSVAYLPFGHHLALHRERMLYSRSKSLPEIRKCIVEFLAFILFHELL